MLLPQPLTAVMLEQSCLISLRENYVMWIRSERFDLSHLLILKAELENTNKWQSVIWCWCFVLKETRDLEGGCIIHSWLETDEAVAKQLRKRNGRHICYWVVILYAQHKGGMTLDLRQNCQENQHLSYLLINYQKKDYVFFYTVITLSVNIQLPCWQTWTMSQKLQNTTEWLQNTMFI